MKDILKLRIEVRKAEINEVDKCNINWNLKKTPNRVTFDTDIKEQSIAIVGYGPSLKDTWELIRNYDVILTTSGAHNFLIERGIIPVYHVECDPRIHKAAFTKHPHEGVRYLIGSSAHPQIVENLKNNDLWLWNMKVRPDVALVPSEIEFPTYGDVGQMAIYVAKALGYRNMDLFGFDYNAVAGEQHAGDHGNPYNQLERMKCGDRVFWTNDEWIKIMLQFDILLADNPDIKLQITGDGLLSHYLEAKYGSG